MAIVPLTLTISLTLVFTFVIFFLREHARGRISSAERDSLLPLAEESPRLERVLAQSARSAGRCDCADGGRAPCARCSRRLG
jgi:hypothetical protein